MDVMSVILAYCAATAVVVTGINGVLVALFIRIRKAQDAARWAKIPKESAKS